MVLIEEENDHPLQKPVSETSKLPSVIPEFHKEIASDGYETASDGELATDDGDHRDTNEEQKPPEQQDREVEQRESVPLMTESPGDIVSEDEAKQEALAQANNAKVEGNNKFASGNYEEALSKYELALKVAPEMPASVELRSICHSNRGICFLKMGRYEETVKECTKALELNPSYIKALVRRGEAQEKREHYEEAISDMKKILELDPSNAQAMKTIRRLQPLADEKREKMKEEMIGKLKEMGNSLLGRFGMSVDNFKAVKDPNTGSYSISFQQ